MLPVDIPYVQVQETPVVLVQAASAGSAPDYILKTCEEIKGTGEPGAALFFVDPASMLAIYMQKQSGRYVDVSAVRNVTLLKGAAHGKVVSELAPSGRQYYLYKPAPKYQGNDNAVFTAEYAGRRFRIDIELHVFLKSDSKKKSTCYPPQLKAGKKSALGSSDYNPLPFVIAVSDAGLSHTVSLLEMDRDMSGASQHEGN